MVKVWCFGQGGKLIVGNVEVRSMEAARQMARDWNRGNKVSRIEIVANAPVAAQATAVSAI